MHSAHRSMKRLFHFLLTTTVTQPLIAHSIRLHILYICNTNAYKFLYEGVKSLLHYGKIRVATRLTLMWKHNGKNALSSKENFQQKKTERKKIWMLQSKTFPSLYAMYLVDGVWLPIGFRCFEPIQWQKKNDENVIVSMSLQLHAASTILMRLYIHIEH